MNEIVDLDKERRRKTIGRTLSDVRLHVDYEFKRTDLGHQCIRGVVTSNYPFLNVTTDWIILR